MNDLSDSLDPPQIIKHSHVVKFPIKQIGNFTTCRYLVLPKSKNMRLYDDVSTEKLTEGKEIAINAEFSDKVRSKNVVHY